MAAEPPHSVSQGTNHCPCCLQALLPAAAVGAWPEELSPPHLPCLWWFASSRHSSSARWHLPILNPPHPPLPGAAAQGIGTGSHLSRKRELEALCLRVTSLLTPQQPAGIPKQELPNFHPVWAAKLLSALRSFCFPHESSQSLPDVPQCGGLGFVLLFLSIPAGL